jgi:hypothetical protein
LLVVTRNFDFSIEHFCLASTFEKSDSRSRFSVMLCGGPQLESTVWDVHSLSSRSSLSLKSSLTRQLEYG